VSALDVERVLLDSPLVEQAAVLGVDDAVWGEKIGAIVVLSTEGAKRGNNAALAEIKKWVEKEVATYKVPRVWLLQDEIPKNAMGKVMDFPSSSYSCWTFLSSCACWTFLSSCACWKLARCLQRVVAVFCLHAMSSLLCRVTVDIMLSCSHVPTTTARSRSGEQEGP
jgi:hypothetical protein